MLRKFKPWQWVDIVVLSEANSCCTVLYLVPLHRFLPEGTGVNAGLIVRVSFYFQIHRWKSKHWTAPCVFLFLARYHGAGGPAGSCIKHCTHHTAYCTLHSIQYTLHTAYYTLHTIHRTLYTAHYTLHTIHCPSYTAHYTLHTIHCILYTAHYTQHTIHCTLYTAHYTLHTIHCTLYTAHYTLYTAVLLRADTQ